MPEIIYHPEAKAEFNASIDWYGEKSIQAARKFIAEMDRILDKILEGPERFPPVDEFFRVAPVQKFPFQVVYRIDRETIFIMAVAHTKRLPGYWRNRGMD